MSLKDSADEILKGDFIRPQDNLQYLKNLNEMYMCNKLFEQFFARQYLSTSKSEQFLS